MTADVFFSRYAPREKNNLTIDRSRQGYRARITADEDKRSTSLRRKYNRITPTRLRAAKNTEATKPRANLQYYVKSDSINFQRRLDTRLVSNNHPEVERKERVLGWRSGFVGSTEVRMVTDRSQKSDLRRMPSCTRTVQCTCDVKFLRWILNKKKYLTQSWPWYHT